MRAAVALAIRTERVEDVEAEIASALKAMWDNRRCAVGAAWAARPSPASHRRMAPDALFPGGVGRV
jgi:hypothetical protein